MKGPPRTDRDMICSTSRSRSRPMISADELRARRSTVRDMQAMGEVNSRGVKGRQQHLLPRLVEAAAVAALCDIYC